MTERDALRGPVLIGALSLGLLADLLVRVPGRPGLNVALWAAAGVAVLIALLRRRTGPMARETVWLVSGALALAIGLALRDAAALAVFSLVAAAALLMLAAGRAAGAWASRAQVSDVAFAVGRVVLLSIAGPLAWGRGARDPDARDGGWPSSTRTAVRGTLMALPAVVILTALLMSADPVFARLIETSVLFEIEPLVEHLVFAAATAWLAAGYLRAMLVGDDAIMARLHVPRPVIAPAEVSVALWILNVLFLGFIAVQLRYLFGGADLVEITAGLSYAEYARRGFFELVATAALVVPILLLADWAAAPDPSRARDVLRATTRVLVVLLLGVIASAAYRMWLYQDAYGLTESRLYVTVFIVWLILVLGWLVLTVSRGHRERFLFGTIVAGVVAIAALYVMNPHAVIARVNIDRAAGGAEYDAGYLGSLSADAVPTLLARIERLPDAERCAVFRMLAARWSGERPGGWRTWNLSDWRARRMVAQLPVISPCSAMNSEVER